MFKEIKLKIHGRVQGVSFRYYCQQKAEELDVRGKARNLADGTVEVIAQGKAENLEKFLAQCKQGPRWAKVKKIDRRERIMHNLTYGEFIIE